MNYNEFFCYDYYIGWIKQAKKIAPVIPISTYDFKSQAILLRHDVDFDPYAAYKLATIEHQNYIRSTYYFMLTSEHYNLFSFNNKDLLKLIIELGHEIGLHYYGKYVRSKGDQEIIKQIDVLSDLCGKQVTSYSMHMPGKDGYCFINKYLNTYDPRIFNDEIYFSDSRREIKKHPYEFINKASEKTIQILTHPLYYGYNPPKYIDIINTKLIREVNLLKEEIFSYNVGFIDEMIKTPYRYIYQDSSTYAKI